MSDLTDIQQYTKRVVGWADRALPNRTMESALLKLVEEHSELIRDPSAAGEYADIMIMLFDLAHMNGVDIDRALNEKIEINEQRVWVKTMTGTYHHE